MKKNPLRDQYLDLLKKSLLNQLYPELEAGLHVLLGHILGGGGGSLPELVHRFLSVHQQDLYQQLVQLRQSGAWLKYLRPGPNGQPAELTEARAFSFVSHTMIGKKRLDNVQRCLDKIMDDNIPGDLIETGVWKGGSTVFMRGYLYAHGITDRQVWVADSFEGLPPSTHAQDLGVDLSAASYPYLAVGLERVQALFDRYDLLDTQVRFLKGWFKDTLPKAPIERLALARLDGDLYESTQDALRSLYHRLSPGGFLIIDDYNALDQCKAAVQDFRAERGITDRIVKIDDEGVYWRKTTD